MPNLLNWTSDNVFIVVLALITVGFLVAIIREHLETRRFLHWLRDPNNEWRQILYAAARVEMPHDPTICTCRCIDHGYISGGMHFTACCTPCPTCKARIAQGRLEEHKQLAH